VTPELFAWTMFVSVVTRRPFGVVALAAKSARLREELQSLESARRQP